MSLVIKPETAPLKLDEHGVCRVSGTRVTLESILCSFQQGATAEEIMQQYPSVPLPDVYATIAYYLKHRDEVDAYLAESEAESERVRLKIQSQFPLTDMRERLLARRKPVST